MVTAHHNLVGSARVSTVIQAAQLQRDALTAAGFWNSAFRQGSTGQSSGKQVARTRLIDEWTGRPSGREERSSACSRTCSTARPATSAGCSQSGTAPSARPSPTRSRTPSSSLPVSHPNRHNLRWLRSARWFFLATTSLTLSGLTIALQDGPAPTWGAENGQHGPSWLTVLVMNPVRLA